MSDPQAPVSETETPEIWPNPGPAPLIGYLDAVAGQPVLPVATQALVAALKQGWSDPARLHHHGRRAGLVLDTARAAIADFLRVPVASCFVGSSGSDVLRAAINLQLNHTDLTGLLFLQGYRKADFVTGEAG